MKKFRCCRYAALALSAWACSDAWAAYSCNVSVNDTGVIYTAAGNQDSTSSVTLNCTRLVTDANTLTYRIKADNGLNFSTNRRARLGATANYLTYFLRRGTVVGGAATCGNTTTWANPATGTTNVITGTVSFGAALVASPVVWGYCVRVRGGVAPNTAAPTAGGYTDSVGIVLQYPSADASPNQAAVNLDYTIGVAPYCVFNSFPQAVGLNYTAFSASAVTATQVIKMRCNNARPWTIAISPSVNVLSGIQYSLLLSTTLTTGGAVSATGIGTGLDQTVNINASAPAGQAGSCAGSCTNSTSHSLTISY